MIFILGETNFFAKPDAAYCKAVRSDAGMTFDVVIDPDKQHLAYGQRDIALVLSEDGTIVFKSSYGKPHQLIWDAVEAELAKTP